MNLLQNWENQDIYFVSDSDLDGVGARIIGHYYIEPICRNFIFLNTSERDMSEFNISISEKSNVIIFVDITPTLDLYKKLIQKNKSVYIFDHHKTGREIIGERENYFFDLNRCGSEILFEEITRNRRKKRIIVQLIELISTYDLWKNNSILWKDAKSLNSVLYSYSSKRNNRVISDTIRHKEFVDMQLKKLNSSKHFFFTQFEKRNILLAEKRERQIYKETKKKMQFRVDNQNNNYIYIEVPSKLSLIASRILNEYGDKIQYVAGFCTYDRSSTKVSLRSRENFNVAQIAEKYNGGGHEQSAGVKLEKDFFEKFRNGTENLI